ncbi:Theileria-specific sub-telomeric protein, SVSP family, putative [Theileria annulata]|uniref:Theileria-specific sub-telomeric protein, SVSP family, putative n=1 Tax=Theileria annulata TaxID=5874 RepID=Q4UAS8_THEAN|nr:Theileria-specific sub-telomeric protein, SVSP family, putative [Theileria annulata]CAI76073.1 Theileria-specific sub-telomeric protein, SVSP family, putative [Theileria annulata]|eukprot:XP_955549.1 Theileria-specific sub-telomeric protein, SVSP family, putative [Theileria annulata]
MIYYRYLVLFIIIGYSRCADKPSNTDITTGDGSDYEEDNFQVIETTETLTEGLTETQPEHEHETTRTETVNDVETQTDLEQLEHEPQPDNVPPPIQPTRYYLIEPQFQYPGYHSIYYYPPHQPVYLPLQPQYPVPQPIPQVEPTHYYPGYEYPEYEPQPTPIQPPQPQPQPAQPLQPYQSPQLHYEPYQQYYPGYPPVPYPPYQPHPGYQPQPTPQYGPYGPYQPYYPEPHQPYGPYQPQPVPIDEGIQESIDEPQYVEKQRKKPKKKKYKSIIFMKKDQDGKLVEMDGEDYKMAFSDSFKSKFIIKGKLEEIFFEGETVWKHMDGNDYPSFVAYNKIIKKFLIFVGQRFFLSRKVNGTWKISSRKVPKYLRMFTKDDEGNDVKITDNQYDFEVTQRGEVIYKIVPGVKCNKIMINEKSIYINRFNKGFPLSVYLNLEGELIVEFKNCTILFKIIDGDYRPLITKRR